jgi:predicted nucleotidyltransferase
LGYLAAKLGKDQPNEAEKLRIIGALRDAILARVTPQAIIVFGSILGEDFTHASDIDCAVIFADRLALQDGRKKLFCAPLLIEMPYDLLLYDQAEFRRKSMEGGICQVIGESGRVIYDQKSEV